jgi:hypothetical protein
MALKTALKRYAGVYFTESKIRRWRERPDRCYWVAFKDAKTSKLYWERCGWASEGWTPEAAQRRRYELLEQDRAGEYKPKQERKADQLTFGDLMEKHYLPWAGENKKHAHDDRSRYLHWLKPRFADKLLKDVAPLDLERIKKGRPERARLQRNMSSAWFDKHSTRRTGGDYGAVTTHVKQSAFPNPTILGNGS